MKRVIYIGNRDNTLKELLKLNNYFTVIKVFVLRNSLLEKSISLINLDFEVFAVNKNDKNKILNLLKSENYDVLVSNGCPFILPISKIKVHKPLTMFINTHPTYLPHLKGKTPLNGVFVLNYSFIGATTHFIDDGIDSGNIICQEKVDLTSDIDQGLVYFISFDLEGFVFNKAMRILIEHDFSFDGYKQVGDGSYFNRENFNYNIDIDNDKSDFICRKINSLAIKALYNKLHYKSGRITKTKYCELISSNYLLQRFSNKTSGDILLEYEDKILLKTIDGIVKITIEND